MVTTTEAPLSPRVAALQREVATGNTGALETFWREITEQGTPLVEPLDDADDHVLLTFLWRAGGGSALRNVVVLLTGNLGEPELAHNQLRPLPNTDLWHKSYRVRTDLRLSYQLSPNDSLVPLRDVKPDDWPERMATWQRDPLNRHPYPGDHPWASSSITLPAAPPQPWVAPRPGVPAGAVGEHRVASAILGNERRVWVYTPPGYTPDGAPYDLLLLFDGGSYTQIVPTPTILDNLLAAGLLPPLIAVLPGNPDQPTRSRELPCHPPFVDFLTQGLLPWARGRWHFTDDPARTVVAGSSYGGLAAAFAALRRPDVFGNVLSQAGSFMWKPDGEREPSWLPRQYAAAPRLPLRLYLDIGLLESAPSRDDGPSGVAANRHMRDILRAKGYPVHYAEFCGGHDYLCWQGTLADGLRALRGTPRHGLLGLAGFR